jgi:CubicO group peptidase (beta-lactamase class C family)
MTLTLHRTSALLEAGRGGLHLGGQVYVALAGDVADFAFGEARPGRPFARDDLMLWLSSGKPVTAVAVARLWERGALALDDPVARHVPEFGANGKEKVTVRHLLTHTAGIRTLGLGWPQRSWQEILRQICELKLEPRWRPGRTAGYHLASSWFVLGEIVQRLSGEPFSEHVRREIFAPLGMHECWIGMPPAVHRELASRIAPMFDTASGEPRQHDWTNEVQLIHASPGANAVGPVAQLGRFYRMLLGGGELEGVRLITPQTVEAFTARQRVGLFDKTFRQVLDWGLGFVLDSRHYGEARPAYGYGEHASARTFGHSGYRSSTAFADPEAGLVVALAVNGTPSAEAHTERFHALTTAIYEDLDLAPPHPEE